MCLCLLALQVSSDMEATNGTEGSLGATDLEILSSDQRQSLLQEMSRLRLLNDSNVGQVVSPYLKVLDLRHCSQITTEGLFGIACRCL